MKQPIITPVAYREILKGLLFDRYEQELAALIRDVLLEEFSYAEEKEAWQYQHPLWAINFVSEQLDSLVLDDLHAFVERIRTYMHRFLDQQIERRLSKPAVPVLEKKK